MQLSAGLQHAQRLFQRVPAKAVQNDVVTAEERFEILAFVVDDDVGAEALHQIDIRRAGSRRNDRAEMLGQLNGEGSQATGAGMDQDLLALASVALFRPAPARR